MARASLARGLHDLGLAAWFGGALMGAVGLNGAAAAVTNESDRARVASVGWAKWAPVNGAAIAAHLVGGALVVQANKSRIGGQHGVAGWTTAKAALTGAAVTATAASGFYGAKVAKAGPVPAAGATEATSGTPDEAAQSMKRLRLLQWCIPALTGSIVIANVIMGEQQRPGEVAKGAARRLAQAATVTLAHPEAAMRTVGSVLQHAV